MMRAGIVALGLVFFAIAAAHADDCGVLPSPAGYVAPSGPRCRLFIVKSVREAEAALGYADPKDGAFTMRGDDYCLTFMPNATNATAYCWFQVLDHEMIGHGKDDLIHCAGPNSWCERKTGVRIQ